MLRANGTNATTCRSIEASSRAQRSQNTTAGTAFPGSTFHRRKMTELSSNPISAEDKIRIKINRQENLPPVELNGLNFIRGKPQAAINRQTIKLELGNVDSSTQILTTARMVQKVKNGVSQPQSSTNGTNDH